MSHEMARRGVWPDLSHLSEGVVGTPEEALSGVLARWIEKLAPLDDPLERTVGGAGPLYGRGTEEYARWLAWAVREAGDAAAVLPMLGVRDVAAVRMCAGVSAEAAQLRNAPNWVLVRFRGRAFVGIEVLATGPRLVEDDGPELWRKATRQGLAAWRVGLGDGGTLGWPDVSRGLRQMLPWMARRRGYSTAGLIAHFVACIEQEWLGMLAADRARGQEARATASYLEGALEWVGLV